MSSATEEKARQTKGEKRRDEIVSIARSVLIAEGYDAFVLRGIAERAEMKLGNLQYYFSTREDLLEELARAENQKALSILSNVEQSDAIPTEKIGRLVEDLLGAWHREGGKVFAVVTLLAIHNARFRRVYMDYYDLFYVGIGALLKSLDPTASDDSIRRKARLATALLDGAPLQVPLRRRRGSKKERQEFAAEITDALLRILEHDA